MKETIKTNIRTTKEDGVVAISLQEVLTGIASSSYRRINDYSD